MRRFSFTKTLKHFKPLIIVAPMNGSINNPEFAAAVMNSGGVGSFGFTYHTADAIMRDIKATRAISTGIINANFFIYDQIDEPCLNDIEAASSELCFRVRADKLDIKQPCQPYHLNLEMQLEAIWNAKPEMLTFHFGLPPKEVITEAHALGIQVGITATTVGEGEAVLECGADFIVAQGIEAGGHSGRFYPTDRFNAGAGALLYAYKVTYTQNWVTEYSLCAESKDSKSLSTLNLVKALCSRSSSTSKLPIVAAGGIMTGKT